MDDLFLVLLILFYIYVIYYGKKRIAERKRQRLEKQQPVVIYPPITPHKPLHRVSNEDFQMSARSSKPQRKSEVEELRATQGDDWWREQQ